MSEALTEFRPDWRVHPGSMLKEVLEEHHLTQRLAAKSLGITESYLSDFINGHRPVSIELAQRIGTLFGPTPSFWLRLQALYELPLRADWNAADLGNGDRP